MARPEAWLLALAAAALAGCECGGPVTSDAGADAQPSMDAGIDGGPDASTSVDAGADGGPACAPLACGTPTHRWDVAIASGARVIPAAVATGADVIAVVGSYDGRVDFGGGARDPRGPVSAFVLALDEGGGYLWDRTFAGVAAGVAVDVAGRVAVTGWFWDTTDLGGGERTSAGGADGFLVRYRPDGAHDWDVLFTGPDGAQEARAVSSTAGGGLLVAGRFEATLELAATVGEGETLTSAGGFDGFVARYGADGRFWWGRPLSGPNDTAATAIACSEGHVAVAGTLHGMVDLGGGPRGEEGAGGGFVAVYDIEGAHVWDRVLLPIRSSTGATVQVTTVAIDAVGGLAVAGHLYGYLDLGSGPREGANGIFLARYGGAGEPRWDRVLSSNISGTPPMPRALSFDHDGELVVAGTVAGRIDLGDGRTAPIGGWGDAFVAAYDGEDGCPRWALRLGGQSRDGAEGLALTADGDLLLAGYFSGDAYLGGEVRSAESERALFVASFDPTISCCDRHGTTCEGGGCCTDLWCAEGECRAPFAGCGGLGEECCAGGACDERLSCVSTWCVPCGTPGAACCPPPEPCPFGGTCTSANRCE